MFTTAVIQVRDPDRPSVEARAAQRVLEARGLECTIVTLKRLTRRQVRLTPETLFVGDLDGASLALKQLGITGPLLETYPSAARPFLARRVWSATLVEARRFVEVTGERVFIKPRERWKRFTGFVYTSRADDFRFQGASQHLPVYCSSVVRFAREYRVYLVDGSPVGICQYEGDDGPAPDNGFIRSVVEALRERGELVAGFALDIGVLDSGDPAIVECNDGFGLGLYSGLSEDSYVNLLWHRWEELVRARGAQAR